MYILLLAPLIPHPYRVAFLTPHVAPSSPVAPVALPRHLASSLHVTSSSSRVALATLVQSQALRPLNARRMVVRFIFLFYFSFADSLSLTCIPSLLFCHASTLLRFPSPRVHHAPPPRHVSITRRRLATRPSRTALVTHRVAPCRMSPIALPRCRGTWFGLW